MIIDPLKFINTVWPHVKLYDKQREILYSVEENFATFVPAANQMGNIAQFDRTTGNRMGAVQADLTESRLDTMNGDYMAASADREAAQLTAMGMGGMASVVEEVASIERAFGF